MKISSFVLAVSGILLGAGCCAIIIRAITGPSDLVMSISEIVAVFAGVHSGLIVANLIAPKWLRRKSTVYFCSDCVSVVRLEDGEVVQAIRVLPDKRAWADRAVAEGKLRWIAPGMLALPKKRSSI